MSTAGCVIAAFMSKCAHAEVIRRTHAASACCSVKSSDDEVLLVSHTENHQHCWHLLSLKSCFNQLADSDPGFHYKVSDTVYF